MSVASAADRTRSVWRQSCPRSRRPSTPGSGSARRKPGEPSANRDAAPAPALRRARKLRGARLQEVDELERAAERIGHHRAVGERESGSKLAAHLGHQDWLRRSPGAVERGESGEGSVVVREGESQSDCALHGEPSRPRSRRLSRSPPSAGSQELVGAVLGEQSMEKRAMHAHVRRTGGTRAAQSCTGHPEPARVASPRGLAPSARAAP